jgi:hypothetical protein
MKLRVISIALVLATCPAYGQRNGRSETEAVNRACSVEDCFLEAQIRDFEVIDRTHLIVYVGAQRCAFHVELRGALCDLSFAPELYFRRTNEVPMIVGERPTDALGTGGATTPRVGTRSTDFDPFELERRERRDLRVCDNDLSVQVHGGRWTESDASSGVATDRFGNPRTDCRVSNVISVTDDQLLEFYVGRGVVAPVPPMGTGEIEVGEQEEQGAAPPNAETPPPARGRRNSGEAD